MDSESTNTFYLEKAYSAQRLSHALLVKLWPNDILNPESSPIFYSAIKGLLCSESSLKSLKACDRCSSCQLFNQWINDQSYQVHPDLISISPESTQGFTVDQIRDMTRFLALKNHLSPRRVVLIHKAELLRAAHGAPANALLKVLEEPRPGHHIFLLSAHPELLLPTLRSRCQHFSLKLKSQGLELHEEWKNLSQWISRSCPPQNNSFIAPPDNESFWKERSEAIEELEESFKLLWRESTPKFAQWDNSQSRRVLDFFEGLESIIKSLRGFGNGLLHWQNLKSHALKGISWRP